MELKPKQYSVYMHINKTNGKKYVGITSQIPSKRWDCGRGYIGQVFHHAIEKYGWDGFDHVILHFGLTEKEALEKESELIKKYDTTNSKYGYNQIPYGTVLSGESLERMRESQRKRMILSNPMKGKHHSEETRKKISQNHADFKGEKGTFYGKKHSENARKAISEKAKNRYKDTAKHPMSKAVKCIETGEVFSCAADAAKKYGIDKSGVCKAVRGAYKQCGGFHWVLA